MPTWGAELSPSPPRRGAVMPRKKKKVSLLDGAAPKTKRGRPRKTIEKDALIPLGKHEVVTAKKYKSLEEKWKPSKKKSKNLRTNPVTSDWDYTSDEIEFMRALDEFKRSSGRMFPTCSEILNVLRRLGYEKIT